jgi:hypothetical protein
MIETTIESVYKYIQIETINFEYSDHKLEKLSLINNIISYLNENYNTQIELETISQCCNVNLAIQDIVNEGNQYLYCHDFPYFLVYCEKKDNDGKPYAEIIVEKRCENFMHTLTCKSITR